MKSNIFRPIKTLNLTLHLKIPRFNYLPNDKIPAVSELKVFPDDSSKLFRKLNLSFKDKYIEGKEKNSGYQRFSFFPDYLKWLVSHAFVKGYTTMF